MARASSQLRKIGFVVFVAVFLLEGTLLACSNRSITKIVLAKPMACCSKVCQRETTPQEAQTACNTTAIQVRQGNQVIPLEDNAGLFFIALSPPPFQGTPPFSFVDAPRNDTGLEHPKTVPLYLLSHALLI